MSKFIFIHIPKTAGSTLRTIFSKEFNPNERYLISSGNTVPPEYQYEVANKTLKFINKSDALKDFSLIYGHLPFDLDYFPEEIVKFGCFLREPIKRVISSYNYILTSPLHPLYPLVKDKSIIEYAGNRNLQLDNLQLRLIIGKPKGDISKNDFEMAKKNLTDHFSFVGLTEYFDLSMVFLKEILDWKSYPLIKAKNVTKHKNQVTKEEIESLKKIYEYDILLYEYALNMFMNKFNSQKSYYTAELEKLKKDNLLKTKTKPSNNVMSKIHPIKKLFRKIGIEISRYKKETPPKPNNLSVSKKEERTNDLTFYETKTGNFYLPTNAHRDIIAKAIINNKIFEPEVVELAKKYIKPGTCVLDVGSNFGQMAIIFGKTVGDNGKVYAFDADDFIFSILKKNISANNLDNIVIPNFGAVHNVAGDTLIFPEHDLSRWGTYGAYGIDYNASKGREVPTITIDSLEIKEPISFMKVDVQGGDLMAMEGAIKTIEKNKMPILFEYEYHLEEEFKLCFQDYVDFVSRINYKFHKVISGHNFLIIPNN
ncbi:MAG: FkbM family methyltransferase [Chitinophagales bacterium]